MKLLLNLIIWAITLIVIQLGMALWGVDVEGIPWYQFVGGWIVLVIGFDLNYRAFNKIMGWKNDK